MALEDYEKELQKRKDEELARLKSLLPQLKELKIAKITITYNGSGDEGAYDPVVFENADGTAIEVLESLRKTVQEAIEDVITNTYGGGWWNNEGATGNAELTVKTGKLQINHEWYQTATSSDYKTLEL